MNSPDLEPTDSSTRTTGAYPRGSHRAHASVARLEVGLAPRSASNFYGDFEDKVRGVFVATYSLLPVGAPVQLALHLPGGVEREVAGTVAWRRERATLATGCGMGIEFDGPLDDCSRDLFETFAVWRAPLFFG